MFMLANEETYTDGQVIFRENSPGDWVYIILSGNVEIFRTIGEKKFVLSSLKAGDVFGEMAFIGNTKRTASAIAVGITVIAAIDRDTLDREFNKLSSDFRFILKTLVSRFTNMNGRVSELTSREEQRIKKTLSLSYKDHESFVNAYTYNIGKGGLFIKTANPLPEGESFILKLKLPGVEEQLKINCVVAWVNKDDSHPEKPAGMGLKFVDMNVNERHLIDKYIGSILAK